MVDKELIIGLDKLGSSGDHGEKRKTKVTEKFVIDNCIEYYSFEYNPCNTGFVLGEHLEGENVDIKLVSDINNERYIYPVCTRNFAHSIGTNSWSMQYDDSSFLDFISDTALEHIKTGQAKLFVDYGFEQPSRYTDGILNEKLLRIFESKLKIKNIPFQNVIYCDQNILLENSKIDSKINLITKMYNINTMYRYALRHTDDVLIKNQFNRSRDEIRSKYYLCYTRLPKTHRALMALSLFKNNILNKGLVSFPDETNFLIKMWAEGSEYLKDDHISGILSDNLLKSYIDCSDDFKKLLPLVLDFDKWTLPQNPMSISLFVDHYFKSYFSIVNESTFDTSHGDGDTLFFTEKTLKPIMNFHPFILLSNKGTIKKLKEYGFKTFHPFIDESYDNISSRGERFLAIEQEINKLCNKSIEEIHEWYWSIEDVLKHNYYHFYRKVAPMEKNKFLNKLNMEISRT